MTRVRAFDINMVEPCFDTAASDTVAAFSLIERAGCMVRRLEYADELNPAQWESVRSQAERE